MLLDFIYNPVFYIIYIFDIRSLTEDDILRYEGVTRGDIINAFASVNSLRKEKTKRPDSMDIETYSQDVYEPGYGGAGTQNRLSKILIY